MKIAIKGHASRGKEVIQILESLGGVNRCLLKGNSTISYYYISYNSNNTISCHDFRYVNKHCKTYTLEEFEKEFPFKVGDKVFLGEDDECLYTIKSISVWHDGDIVYELAENELHYSANKLTLYKEMKEERNITLTLDKAKEWYNKGGELKEVALQAYSEEELTKVELPKTWEEFCDNYMVNENEAHFDSCCTIHSADITCRDSVYDKNICPSKESAEAHLAMIQLEQLRNCWRQGWKPTSEKAVYAIKVCSEKLDVFYYCTREFLSFPTREMAEEFLKYFRDLIEKAGDLI